MSPPDYTQVSTEELLRQFVETAKLTGSVWTSNIELLKPTPKRRELVAKMQGIGAELRARKPIAKLRQLFDDGDSDVRGWAGPQFLGADPVWASATTSGLAEGLTTREILAWRDRTLAGPPPGPPIAEMTIEQMVERFKDACTRLYATTRFLSDEEGGGLTMIAYNHISGEPYEIARELKARARLNVLVPLLDNPLVTVRQKAATYCLAVAPEKAVSTLKEIGATKKWPECTFASDTLESWQKGTYRPFAP